MKFTIKNLAIFSGLLILLATSCEYKFNEVNSVSLIPPDGNVTGSIQLNDTMSVIDIGLETEFFYNIDIGNLKQRAVNIYLNENLIETKTAISGSFIIDPYDYGTGSYILKIEVIAKTGSNSMAESLGAESYFFTKEWKLNMDINRPDYVKIVNSEINDGYLKITWNKYTRPNFQCYNLSILNDIGMATKFPPITSRDSNSYVDKNYVGGPINYGLSVKASNYTTLTYSNPVYFPLPEIKEVKFNDLECSINWSSCLFNSAFEKYTVYNSFCSGCSVIFKLKSTTDIKDTTLVSDKLLFGGPNNFELITYSKGGQKCTTIYENAYIGDVTPSFRSMDACAAINSIFATNYKEEINTGRNTLYKITDKNIVSDSIAIFGYINNAGIDISENGKYLIWGTDKIHIYDPVTMNEIKSITPAITDWNYLYSLSISNNGICSYTNSDSLVIYDIINDKIIAKKKSIGLTKISNSGLYCVDYQSEYTSNHGFKLYKIYSDSIELIHYYNPVYSVSGVSFNPNNEQEIIFYDNYLSKLFINDCETFENIKSYDLPVMNIYNIDPVNGKVIMHLIGVRSNEYDLRIAELDLANGDLTFYQMAYQNGTNTYYKYGNNLYSSIGRTIAVKPVE